MGRNVFLSSVLEILLMNDERALQLQQVADFSNYHLWQSSNKQFPIVLVRYQFRCIQRLGHCVSKYFSLKCFNNIIIL